jgi:hypothetical protein
VYLNEHTNAVGYINFSNARAKGHKKFIGLSFTVAYAQEENQGSFAVLLFSYTRDRLGGESNLKPEYNYQPRSRRWVLRRKGARSFARPPNLIMKNEEAAHSAEKSHSAHSVLFASARTIHVL